MFAELKQYDKFSLTRGNTFKFQFFSTCLPFALIGLHFLQKLDYCEDCWFLQMFSFVISEGFWEGFCKHKL